MTVAQLIEKLKEFPPDLPVTYFDADYGVQVQEVECVEHITGFEMDSSWDGEDFIKLS